MKDGTHAGREPRARPVAPPTESPDAGTCVVCGDPADGLNARLRVPVCREHAHVYVAATREAVDAGPDRTLLCDGGVVVTEHAETRWRQRSDTPEDLTVADAWDDADPVGETLSTDERRHHAPSGTILLRRASKIVTVLDERMVDREVSA